MANSQLLNKQYPIPKPIINRIKAKLVANPNSEGTKRAKFIINNGVITYQNLKRIKNFFDTYTSNNGDATQFELIGGNDMRNWIQRTLDSERKSTQNSREIKREGHVNLKSEIKPPTGISDLRESDNETNNIKNKNTVKENALVIIFNNDKDILLLKRSPYIGWGANQWALVGGGVEKNETPEQAVKRELQEETGLNINNFLEKFKLQRNPDSVEYCFVGKYDGDNNDVNLNNENTEFGWFSSVEMEYLDTVPNLKDYINVAISKYE